MGTVTDQSNTRESMGESVNSLDFDIQKTRDEVCDLQSENKRIKETIVDLQSKSILANLIMSGIEETKDETSEQTKQSVITNFKGDLNIPEKEIPEIEIERVQRFDAKKNDKLRNILVVFKDVKKNEYVKSFKVNVNSKESGKYMHDQLPQERVDQWKMLKIKKKHLSNITSYS